MTSRPMEHYEAVADRIDDARHAESYSAMLWRLSDLRLRAARLRRELKKHVGQARVAEIERGEA